MSNRRRVARYLLPSVGLLVIHEHYHHASAQPLWRLFCTYRNRFSNLFREPRSRAAGSADCPCETSLYLGREPTGPVPEVGSELAAAAAVSPPALAAGASRAPPAVRTAQGLLPCARARAFECARSPLRRGAHQLTCIRAQAHARSLVLAHARTHAGTHSRIQVRARAPSMAISQFFSCASCNRTVHNVDQA